MVLLPVAIFLGRCVAAILKGKEKAFMKRNSFIEMVKLHNLSGRITYISSHAK